MNDESSSEFGAFLAGFVIGGLVGAAAALVLAPKSGSETRSQIVGKGLDLRDASSERVHSIRDNADQLLNRSEPTEDDESFDTQEQARIILDSGRQQAQAAVEIDILPPEDEAETPPES